MVLEDGQSKMKVQDGLVSGESVLTGSFLAMFSLCSYMVERE